VNGETLDTPVQMSKDDTAEDVLVRVRDLEVGFPVRSGVLQRTTGLLKAVDRVDLDVRRGEIVGLVGESGCGKSTLGRAMLNLTPPTAGSVEIDGRAVSGLRGAALKAMRRQMQMVFQDPVGSLDPRLSVEAIIAEALSAHGIGSRAERSEMVRDVMRDVGLDPAAAKRFPHEFSGGQRQRIGIARALVLKPAFIVADEPVSALDVSIQSQVLNLLVDLRRKYELTYLFVAHDLAVVNYLADRIAVMYLGRIVEFGTAAEIVENPQHPYTVALMSAVPEPEVGAKRERIVLTGDVPSPLSPPSGCRFRTRCPVAQDICATVEPQLDPSPTGQRVACHFPGSLSAAAA
jgi:oligopeptide/dipeptide ABC transporter ATP-binding protein